MLQIVILDLNLSMFIIRFFLRNKIWSMFLPSWRALNFNGDSLLICLYNTYANRHHKLAWIVRLEPFKKLLYIFTIMLDSSISGMLLGAVRAIPKYQSPSSRTAVVINLSVIVRLFLVIVLSNWITIILVTSSFTSYFHWNCKFSQLLN